jgi:hypothetical protein
MAGFWGRGVKKGVLRNHDCGLDLDINAAYLPYELTLILDSSFHAWNI